MTTPQATSACQAELSGLSQSFLSAGESDIQIVFSADDVPVTATAAVKAPAQATSTNSASGSCPGQQQHLARPHPPAAATHMQHSNISIRTRHASGTGRAAAAAPPPPPPAAAANYPRHTRDAAAVWQRRMPSYEADAEEGYADDMFEDPPTDTSAADAAAPTAAPETAAAAAAAAATMSAASSAADAAAAGEAASGCQWDVLQELEQLHRSLPLANTRRRRSSSSNASSNSSGGYSSASTKQRSANHGPAAVAAGRSQHNTTIEASVAAVAKQSSGVNHRRTSQQQQLQLQHLHKEQQQLDLLPDNQSRRGPSSSHTAAGKARGAAASCTAAAAATAVSDSAAAAAPEQTAAAAAAVAAAQEAAAATEALLASLPVLQQGSSCSNKHRSRPSSLSTTALAAPVTHVLRPSTAPPQYLAQPQDIPKQGRPRRSRHVHTAHQLPAMGAAMDWGAAAEELGAVRSPAPAPQVPSGTSPGSISPAGQHSSPTATTGSTIPQHKTRPCTAITEGPLGVARRSVAVQVGSMNDKGFQVVYDSCKGVLLDGACEASCQAASSSDCRLPVQQSPAANTGWPAVGPLAALLTAARSAAGTCPKEDVQGIQSLEAQSRWSAASITGSAAAAGAAGLMSQMLPCGVQEQQLRTRSLWPATLQQLKASLLLSQLDLIIQQLQHQQTQLQCAEQQQLPAQCYHVGSTVQQMAQQRTPSSKQDQQQHVPGNPGSAPPQQQHPVVNDTGHSDPGPGLPAFAAADGSTGPHHNSGEALAKQQHELASSQHSISQWVTIPLTGQDGKQQWHSVDLDSSEAPASKASSAAAAAFGSDEPYSGSSLAAAAAPPIAASSDAAAGVTEKGWVTLPVFQEAPAAAPASTEAKAPLPVQSHLAAAATAAAAAAVTPTIQLSEADGWHSLGIPPLQAVQQAATGCLQAAGDHASLHTLQEEAVLPPQANEPRGAGTTRPGPTEAAPGWFTLPAAATDTHSQPGQQGVGQHPQLALQQQHVQLLQPQEQLDQQDCCVAVTQDPVQLRGSCCDAVARVLGVGPSAVTPGCLDPTSAAGPAEIHTASASVSMQSCAACSSALPDVTTFPSSAAVVVAAAAGSAQESADTAGDATLLNDDPAFAASEGHVSGNRSDTAAVAVEAMKQQQQQEKEEQQEQREPCQQQQEPSPLATASYRPLDTLRRYQAFLQAEAAGGVPGLSPASAAALRQQLTQLTAAAVQHPQQPQLQPCALKSSSLLQQLQQVRDSLANSTVGARPGCGCNAADTASYATCVAQELASCSLTTSCLRQNVSRVSSQVRTLNRMLLSHSQQLTRHYSRLHSSSDAGDTVQGLSEVPAAEGCVEGGAPARHQLDQGCSSNEAAAAGGLQRDCYTTLEHTLMEIRQHRAQLC